MQLPDLDNGWSRLAQPIISTEANVWHEGYLETRAEDYSPEVRQFLKAGKATLATDYVKAIQGRARLRRQVQFVFTHCEFLVTPGQLIPPPLHTTRTITVAGKEFSPMAALVSASCIFNLTGHPALTMPCGFTTTGVPLALQIVGKSFDEATILRVGHAYEINTSWHEQQPPLRQ